MEGRIVGTDNAAIELRGVGVLLLDGSEMVVANNLDSQMIAFLAKQTGDIEPPPLESTLDAT